MVNTTPLPIYPRERDQFCRRLGGPQGRSGRVRKIPPHTDVFYILLISVLHPDLFLFLDCPAFCLFIFH